MRLALVVTLAGLASCAGPRVTVRTGPPSAATYPQASEQCRAQPWLDWCRPADARR